MVARYVEPSMTGEGLMRLAAVINGMEQSLKIQIFRSRAHPPGGGPDVNGNAPS
jgi:hypothetical protein